MEKFRITQGIIDLSRLIRDEHRYVRYSCNCPVALSMMLTYPEVEVCPGGIFPDGGAVLPLPYEEYGEECIRTSGGIASRILAFDREDVMEPFVFVVDRSRSFRNVRAMTVEELGAERLAGTGV